MMPWNALAGGIYQPGATGKRNAVMVKGKMKIVIDDQAKFHLRNAYDYIKRITTKRRKSKGENTNLYTGPYQKT